MRRLLLLTLVLPAITGSIIYLWFSPNSEMSTTRHDLVLSQASVLLGFDLKDPNQAPLFEKMSVERGYQILMNTTQYLESYIPHTKLSCSSCHFGEGDTLGGKNNGISLVGVTAIYPQYSERFKTNMSLKMRINNCFERSMNGYPIPEDSQAMKDIVAYLEWISVDVKHLHALPWLGLPEIKSNHKPDGANGQKVYIQECAMCHHVNGEGSETAPPLWGEASFNDGAGMNKMSMLAPFILLNMPHGNATLTEEQALDVAAYIQAQKRPQFRNGS